MQRQYNLRKASVAYYHCINAGGTSYEIRMAEGQLHEAAKAYGELAQRKVLLEPESR